MDPLRNLLYFHTHEVLSPPKIGPQFSKVRGGFSWVFLKFEKIKRTLLTNGKKKNHKNFLCFILFGILGFFKENFSFLVFFEPPKCFPQILPQRLALNHKQGIFEKKKDSDSFKDKRRPRTIFSVHKQKSGANFNQKQSLILKTPALSPLENGPIQKNNRGEFVWH